MLISERTRPCVPVLLCCDFIQIFLNGSCKFRAQGVSCSACMVAQPSAVPAAGRSWVCCPTCKAWKKRQGWSSGCDTLLCFLHGGRDGSKKKKERFRDSRGEKDSQHFLKLQFSHIVFLKSRTLVYINAHWPHLAKYKLQKYNFFFSPCYAIKIGNHIGISLICICT